MPLQTKVILKASKLGDVSAKTAHLPNLPVSLLSSHLPPFNEIDALVYLNSSTQQLQVGQIQRQIQRLQKGRNCEAR